MIFACPVCHDECVSHSCECGLTRMIAENGKPQLEVSITGDTMFFMVAYLKTGRVILWTDDPRSFPQLKFRPVRTGDDLILARVPVRMVPQVWDFIVGRKSVEEVMRS